MNYWEKRDAHKRLENEGVEVRVTEYPDWTFRVRQLGAWNPHYQRAMVRVAQRPEARDLIEREQRPGYVASVEDQRLTEDMTRDAFAEGCLASWQGVTDRNGQPLAFSPEAAAEFLEHFEDIYRALRAVAIDPTRFDPLSDAKKEALARGNFVPASGSQPGRGGSSLARLPAGASGGKVRRAKF